MDNNKNVWANALLKDGKIMFWWSGRECKDEYDFYKDFYFAGLKMSDELKTGKYRLEKQRISGIGNKDEEEFYRRFPIHEDSKGRKPYTEV